MRTDKNDGHIYPFLAIKNKTGDSDFEVILFTGKEEGSSERYTKFYGDASQSFSIGAWGVPRYTLLDVIIGPHVVRYANDAKFYHEFDTKKGREKLLHMFRSIFK